MKKFLHEIACGAMVLIPLGFIIGIGGQSASERMTGWACIPIGIACTIYAFWQENENLKEYNEKNPKDKKTWFDLWLESY